MPLWGQTWWKFLSPQFTVETDKDCSCQSMSSFADYIMICFAFSGQSDEMWREGGDGFSGIQSRQHSTGEWVSEWQSSPLVSEWMVDELSEFLWWVYLPLFAHRISSSVKRSGWSLHNGAAGEQCSSYHQRSQEWARVLGRVSARGDGEDSLTEIFNLIFINI